MGGEVGKRLPPPVGAVEIEGAETQALIDTGATVNIMDTSTLHKLKTCPAIKPTKALIYPYGSKTLLPLRGLIDVTVDSGTKKI